ncbi:MAG: type II secretion system F family protein, partial [Clostridia bacterium]|nr:type II secretion system F family protein [Clostridia bacterium]
NGNKKKGSVTAPDMNQARLQLLAEGLTPIEIKEQNLLTKDIEISFLEGVKPRDLSVFCHQFVSVIDAGVPVAEALSLLSQQTENKTLRKAISQVQKEIQQGETMADAMRKQGKRVFAPMFVNMVAAGEASGNLSVAFARMADYYENANKTKAALQKAMIYPAVVLIVVVIVMFVMMLFVLPTFKGIFEDMGAELPWITRVIMGTSDFFVGYWWLILIVGALAGLGIWLFSRTKRGTYVFAWFARKMPVFGPLTVKTASAQFARTFATLTASGLPIIEALEIVARSMTNVYFKDALLRARERVAVGTSLAESLQRGNLFPPMVIHMVKIGEESGNLEKMLDKLSEYYDEEVQAATKNVMAMLEPMIIVLLCLVVGTVAIGVMLPMFEMYSMYDQYL